MIAGPFSIDLAFSQWVQSWQPDWLTATMKTVSFIGLPGLGLVAFFIILLWWAERGQRHAWWLVILVLLGNILSPLLQRLFSRPRPTADVVQVFQQIDAFSFPSGHALGAVLLGGLIVALTQGRRWHGFFTALAIIIILFVGLSRIYLGVHWLTDVLAGYIIGLLWLTVTVEWIWPRIKLRMHGDEGNNYSLH